jgi:transketolase
MSYGFSSAALSPELKAELAERRRTVAADIVRLVSLSASGHPGGSLSTLDALLVLYACANVDANAPHAPLRDRVVVSHGHVSPGVYGTLASFGFFDIEQAYRGFRRAGSVFGGHIENVVPGVEWNTGNLGQGLSAAAGFAMAARIHNTPWNTFCFMGDGEQQKGQIGEARRFAVKFKLNNLVALLDVNGLQIGGKTADIMDFDLAGDWRADGWNVVEIDGHDHDAIYVAMRNAVDPAATRPTAIFLRTVMGKGISFIENDHNYHGKALSDEQAVRAFAELGADSNLDALRALRATGSSTIHHHPFVQRDVVLDCGKPRTYAASEKTDCRSAYGSALADIATANAGNAAAWPVVGISCDLEGSVKMDAFHKITPDRFLEVGISEHHAAVLTGALSKEKIVPFYSTFGMFAVVEGYNQQRLNDQNLAAPRVVVTHCGLDVGEDGPTHQCIDYVALTRNLFGFETYSPADPNECDRIVRTVAGRYAPSLVAMGRSKVPTITTREGEPVFGGDFEFVPGRWTTVRPGDDAVVFAFGVMVYRAVQASDVLAKEGFGLRVVNASSLKPFDRDAILDAAKTGAILTYEDHNADTGLGAIVAGAIADAGVAVKLKRLGVTKYGTSGVPDDLFAEQGLAPSDLVAAARALKGR